MQKVEIDINEPLSVGDKVELHFKSVSMSWIQDAQVAAIKAWFKLTSQPFEILSYEITDNNQVVFTVRVKKTNPVVVTVAVIATAIIGVGVVAWLTLDKAYKIVESPGSGLAFGSIGLIAIAVIAGLVLNAWRK